MLYKTKIMIGGTMLKDEKAFDILEQDLREKGNIQKFENECGKILGRVLIDFGEIPSDLEESVLGNNKREDLFIFNCSFDFYDTILGIAIKKGTLELASGLWITEQKEGAEAPAKDWIDFFIRMLAENVLNTKEEFGMPIYIFINNDSEMVIQPSSKG